MSNKSNFKKIVEFHKAFGLEHHDDHNKECFDDKKLIKLRLALIEEEFKELKHAINERDCVFDRFGDIVTLVA